MEKRKILTAAEKDHKRRLKDLNKNLPGMIDDVTRFDSVTTQPGLNILYHYTLCNINRAFNPGHFIAYMKNKIIQQFKTNPKTLKDIKDGFTYIYIYSRDRGKRKEIGRFKINKETQGL